LRGRLKACGVNRVKAITGLSEVGAGIFLKKLVWGGEGSAGRLGSSFFGRTGAYLNEKNRSCVNQLSTWELDEMHEQISTT
jgi:hypothetical protein